MHVSSSEMANDFEVLIVDSNTKKDLIGVCGNRSESPATQRENTGDNCSNDDDKLCPYQMFGCKADVTTDSNSHISKCVYGMLVNCRSSLCVGKPSAVYQTPLHLLLHSEKLHGTAMTQVGSTITSKLSFTGKFFYPGEAVYSMKIIRKYQFVIGTDDVIVATYFIVKEKNVSDEFDQDEAVVTIAAIQLAPSKPISYMFLLGLQLSGPDGDLIEPIPSSYPSRGSFSSLSMQDKSSEVLPLNLLVFTSPQEFFVNWKCSERRIRVACFSRDLVQSLGKEVSGSNDVVSLSMTTNFRAYRTHVDIPRSLTVEPWACCWEDVGVNPLSQQNMQDSKEMIPSPISSFIIPQILAKKNIMVDSLIFFDALEAVVAGTLTSIERIRISTKPKQCKAVVIYPSEVSISATRHIWRKQAVPAGLHVFHLPGYQELDEDVFQHFKLHGSDVVLLSLRTLADLIERDDPEVLDILTGSLSSVLLILPSHFSRFNSEESLQAFVDILGAKVHGIQRCSLDYFLPKYIQQKIKLCLSMEDRAIYASVGPDPEYLVEQLKIYGVKIDNADLKNQVILHLIQHHVKDINRWTIFFHEADETEMNYLKCSLLTLFDPKKITIVVRDSDVFKNPNLLTPFEMDDQSIAISGYSMIDFVINTEGIIMFRKPEPKDLIRFSLSFNNNELKIAYLFMDTAGNVI